MNEKLVSNNPDDIVFTPLRMNKGGYIIVSPEQLRALEDNIVARIMDGSKAERKEYE